ncbi:MAG: LlaMI family restriction endonuclease [Minisyncoccales bacterium]
MKDNKKEKRKIVNLFTRNVKGKIPNVSGVNKRHDGKDGHWLETQMGIKHNADNLPDLYGFEMKNNTSSKTTFGDWSADYYIFKDKKYAINRDNGFLKIFGNPNPFKNGRYSWSGKPCPKIREYNDFGQILKIDRKGNIFAMYSFGKDKRAKKNKIVPLAMQKDNLILAKWEAESIKNKLEKKFNVQGWFKCLKVGDKYEKIVFGDPINFDIWIKGVKKGLIIFDSGMHAGNKRPYSEWRASNNYWDSLIREKY